MERLKHFSLAALLMAGAAFTACSSEDNNVIEQSVNTTETKTYTMTIRATKGEAKGGDDATTRALSFSGAKLTATWKKGETVDVYKVTEESGDNVYTSVGTLTAQADGETATLSGNLTGTFAEDDHLALFFNGGNFDYENQTGLLEDIASKYDYAIGEAKVTTIDGSTITVVDWSDNTKSDVIFTNQQAIVKFTLKDNTGNPISVRTLKLHDHTRNIYTLRNYITRGSEQKDLVITRATSGSEFFVALNTKGDLNNIKLTATDPSLNPGKYVYEKTGSVTFTKGKYYEVTVKMTKQTENIVDMADISDSWAYDHNAYTAQDGDVLTGKAVIDNPEYYDDIRISIADGATVTLRNLTINPESGSNHVAINCLGDATIILEGTNTITGSNAIAAPEGKTLTIEGSGSLTATGGIKGGYIEIENGTITATGSNSNAGICVTNDITIIGGNINATGGSSAAGIGSGYNVACGKITISGGTIKATGDGDAAGIGTGYNGTCGNITINKGIVTATGGERGAGIGCGNFGHCGNITIAKTITSVTATHGGLGATSYTAPHSIGVGSDYNYYQDLPKCVCGTITFDTQAFTPTWHQGTESSPENSWTYSPEPVSGTNYGGLTLTISSDTWTLVPAN